MSTVIDMTSTVTEKSATRSRRLTIAWIVGIGASLGISYWPLLSWLGSQTTQITQLSMGALLVLFAFVICFQDTIRNQRIEPNISSEGFALLGVGFIFLLLATRPGFPLLPLIVFSFCLSFAGIISFLFGKIGVRQFVPALGGFFVFAVLVGLFPTLDWPLRAIAAQHGRTLLAWVGAPVELVFVIGGAPTLILSIDDRQFEVATECNGFGLLTSSMLLATILAFHFRLPWINKLGLFLLSIPIALACNFLRIVSICLIAPRVSLSYNLVHEVIGTLFYFGGLGLVWHIAGRHASEDAIEEVVAASRD